MRRLLAVLVVLGLFAVACSADERAGPAAGTGDGEVVEARPASEPVADPAEEHEAVLDDSSIGAGSLEQAGDPGDAPTTIPAEEMMLDELNVGYFVDWPTPSQVAQTEVAHDEVLGSVVNWISFESGVDMARAMEAGEIDISYSQDVTSFATFVTGGSDLLLVGVAASSGAGLQGADGRLVGVISTTAAFAAEYPDAVTGFLQVTEDANLAYNRNREPFIDAIARSAGLDRDVTTALLDALTFPSKDAQLSEAWLGGTVQQVMKEQMDSRVARGEIESALPTYDDFVDTSFLEAVN